MPTTLEQHPFLCLLGMLAAILVTAFGAIIAPLIEARRS